MKKALVCYKECFLGNDGLVFNFRSDIMECDDGMVTEDTVERWRKEIEETRKNGITILGFNKLD